MVAKTVEVDWKSRVCDDVEGLEISKEQLYYQQRAEKEAKEAKNKELEQEKLKRNKPRPRRKCTNKTPFSSTISQIILSRSSSEGFLEQLENNNEESTHNSSVLP